MDNKELIINTLKNSNEPLKGGEIAEKSGVDKKEVDKIIKNLVKEDLIESPKRCFYQLKK
jgi:predicted transcriptional regulator